MFLPVLLREGDGGVGGGLFAGLDALEEDGGGVVLAELVEFLLLGVGGDGDGRAADLLEVGSGLRGLLVGAGVVKRRPYIGILRLCLGFGFFHFPEGVLLFWTGLLLRRLLVGFLAGIGFLLVGFLIFGLVGGFLGVVAGRRSLVPRVVFGGGVGFGLLLVFALLVLLLVLLGLGGVVLLLVLGF